MGKKFSRIFCLLFICACAVPGVGMLLLGESQAAANEVLSPKPVLKNPDGSWNLEVMSDAADYFSDHFAFRQELITADSAPGKQLCFTPRLRSRLPWARMGGFSMRKPWMTTPVRIS